MPTFFGSESATVRRVGRLDHVSVLDNDDFGWHDEDGKFHRHIKAAGDRRSRQIAKRHWVKKRVMSWSSQHGYDKTTTKTPGKREVNLSRPAQ